MPVLTTRSRTFVVASAATAALALIAGAASAQTASAPHWSIVQTLGPAGQASRLQAVTATGPGDAWAAGQLCEGCSPSPRLVVERWNGKGWKQQSLPAKIARNDYGVVSLTASSSTDTWIISSTNSGSVAVRWNGQHWSAQSLPAWVVRIAFGSGLTDNTAVTFGPKNVWDFSLGAATLPTVAARYNGRSWHKAYLPGMPVYVSAVAANDIWAVGPTKKTMRLSTSKQTNIAMHWNGHSWKSITIPKLRSTPPGGFIDAVVAEGPKQLWIGEPTGGPIGDLSGKMLHWNGVKWTHVSVPRGVFNQPTGAPIVQDGHGGLWMQGNGPAPKYLLYLYHYNHGRWTRYLMPHGTNINLLGFSWVPGTAGVWAVGLDTAFPHDTVKALIAGYGT